MSLKELLPKIKSERTLIKNKSQIFTSKDKLINFKVLIKDDNENKLFNEYQDNLEGISKEYFKEQKKLN